MKKKYLLNAKKTEFIPSSKTKCPKSGIFINNYWVGVVGQSNFARQHSVFRALCVNIFWAEMAQSPVEKIGPYAYDKTAI